MIIASISFALMSVMVKLSGGGIPLFQQVFFRNLIMMFFAGTSLWLNKTSVFVPRKQVMTLTLRSFFGFLGVICLFYANNHLMLADAQILQKLNPFFVALLAALILGERLHRRRLLAIAGGFAGALIIINPAGQFGQIGAALVGVASALCGAIAYVMVGKMAGKVKGMVIIFWFSVFSTVSAAVPMAMHYAKPTPVQWFYLLMIGVFAAGGQYFITRAYTTAEASAVAVFDYTGVVLSPLLGLLIFGESLSLRMIVGMAIVVFSGYQAAKKE